MARTRNLGNLTDLLSANTSTGIVSVNTAPAQFDNSSALVPTSFLQQALGNLSAIRTLTTTTTLDASYAGSLVYCAGSPTYTVTLPVNTSYPSGTSLKFFSSGTAITIARTGTDQILVNTGYKTSIVLGTGDSLELVSTGTGNWIATNGTGTIGNAAAFGASKNAPGYQKLPSGVILQWGNALYTGASGTVQLFNFPIAFTTAVYSVIGSVGASLGDATMGFQVSSVTQFSVGFHTTGGGSGTNIAFYWMATGS